MGNKPTYSKYPLSYDSENELPIVGEQTGVAPALFNNLRSAIQSIEAELGLKPSSTYTTVRARLDYLEYKFVAFSPIQLVQDLGGSYQFPQVIGLQARPVSNLAPSIGQGLGWNGAAWSPMTFPATVVNPGASGAVNFSGDLIGNSNSQGVIALRGKPRLALAQ